MSDEGFTNINPDTLPPELQSLYKQMQGDYTRKRQEDANRARAAELQAQELSQQYRESQQQLGQYAQANDMWVEWSKQVADIQSPQAAYDPGGTPYFMEGGAPDPNSYQPMDVPGQGQAYVRRRTEDERTILKQQKRLETLEEQTARLQTALDMALQIDELRHQYKDMDPKLVIDTALQNKLPNLKQARDIAYREQDLKAEVDLKVEERMKELQEQERHKVLDGQTDTPFELFKKMPEKPPSFDNVSEDILRERILGNVGSL